MSPLPLVDRPASAALFHHAGRAIGRDAFLADVAAVVRLLPGGGHAINLCADRYRFVVAFAAGLLQERVSLLSGDTSADALAALRAQHADCVIVADAPVHASMDAICPVIRVERAAPAAPAEMVDIPADRLAALVFTSGSTGMPVAHPKRWGALVGRSRAAGQRFELREDSPATVVGMVPPGHMYGFETTVLLPLHAACASWCGPSFFPADVAAALQAVPEPRILVTTPLQMRALREVPIARLQSCISATAPLEPALASAMEARWAAPVLEIFGATECGSIASRRTIDGEWWTPYAGTALTEADGLVLVGSEGGEPVPLADALELAPDGRFRLLGRQADMVKMAGRRASLAGLNRILTGLDGVDDGVFVVPDDLDHRSTARLVALVVAPGRSAPSILADLRGRMDAVFLPRRVIQVGALPRNPLGKLPRQAVLELLAQAGER